MAFAQRWHGVQYHVTASTIGRFHGVLFTLPFSCDVCFALSRRSCGAVTAFIALAWSFHLSRSMVFSYEKIFKKTTKDAHTCLKGNITISFPHMIFMKLPMLQDNNIL